MPKLRADLLLVQQGLVESRSQAQKLIMAGQVRAGADRLVHRASDTFSDDTELTVDSGLAYVSRGAEKLRPMLESYCSDLSGRVALDIGASTGGFTDLMLQHGAARVYAVDVGHGQLHWKLRQDPRVIVLENTNARHLGPAQIPEPVDVVTMDVSFISVTLILPVIAPLLRPDGFAFILIKPQFEAGREEVGRGGVVRDDAVRQRVVAQVTTFAEQQLSWQRRDVQPSPITGPKGNQEYVALFQPGQR